MGLRGDGDGPFYTFAYANIVEILRSMDSVADVRIEIRNEVFNNDHLQRIGGTTIGVLHDWHDWFEDPDNPDAAQTWLHLTWQFANGDMDG